MNKAPEPPKPPADLGRSGREMWYLAGSISKAVFERDWREIQEQRATLASAAPAPLFTQQQSILTTLVD